MVFPSVYVYSYSSTHGISGQAAGGAWEQFEVHLKMMIEWTQRCTWRPWLSELGDSLGGRDGATLKTHLGGPDCANLEMHSEAVIKLVRRCTWRPWPCEHGGCDWATLEMHMGGHDRVNLEAIIERIWRPWLRDFGDARGGCDRVNLVDLTVRVWTST